jgi:hypothetical protein
VVWNLLSETMTGGTSNLLIFYYSQTHKPYRICLIYAFAKHCQTATLFKPMFLSLFCHRGLRHQQTLYKIIMNKRREFIDRLLRIS